LGAQPIPGATWTIERPSDTGTGITLTFIDADNGWGGGQDLTSDVLPVSIWKRSRSASAIGTHNARAAPDRARQSGVWQTTQTRPTWSRIQESLNKEDELYGQQTRGSLRFPMTLRFQMLAVCRKVEEMNWEKRLISSSLNNDQ